MTSEPYWQPSQQEIDESALNKFRMYVNDRFKLRLQDYWSLWRWSTGTAQEMNDFWTALWDFTGVVGDKGPAPLFDASVPINKTRQFCRNAHVNWAENMLLGHENSRSTKKVAIVALTEPRGTPDNSKSLESSDDSNTHVRSLTYEDLYIEVAQAASALRSAGIGPGDRVAAITPNNAEAIVFTLAATSLGAIWSSVAPEFGVPSILERFSQLKPKVLLGCDEYRASGKNHAVLNKIEEIARVLSPEGLRKVVIVGQLQQDRRTRFPLPCESGTSTNLQYVAYPDFLDRRATTVHFKRMPAIAPLWVLYSSGTTGKPKAIIHGHLGMIFAVKQAGPLHSSLDASDTHLQITTTGWMMWNHMVNHLALGATVLAYDGNPLVPNKLVLFEFIQRYRVTSLSLSPRYLQVLQQAGLKPNTKFDLSTLRSICSAGSPLTVEHYLFVKTCIKHVYIQNVSGGTDVCAGLVGGCPVLPIYAGKIQCPWLGVALAAYDEAGRKVEAGEGDLVITRPLPFMPVGFLGDDDRDTKLNEAYFQHYANTLVWYHADHISIDEHGGITMLGRSDGVLNPQGVRFGSAEIYAVMEELKAEVDDCIAVGQKTSSGDENVILFVRTVNDVPLSRSVFETIRHDITVKLSRRHVPKLIIQCPEIPYTINGKRVEVAVKKIINGKKLEGINTSGLSNPQSLKWFVDRPELRTNSREAKL